HSRADLAPQDAKAERIPARSRETNPVYLVEDSYSNVKVGRPYVTLTSPAAGRKLSSLGSLPVCAPKYFSIVSRLGGGVTNDPMITQSAEPTTIGTTVMKPFQKLTSPRGVRNSTLMASLPWPICQMTSPGLWVF